MYNDNLAYKPLIKNKGHVGDIKHIIKKKPSKKQKATYLKISILIAFFMVASISLLIKNVEVTEQSKRNASLKLQYSELYSQNKKKEMDINKKIDLKTVEEIAIATYGMNRARKEQIVYVDVKGQDYGIVAKAEDEQAEKDKKINTLTGLLAYFEQ
jgi:Tfp pilus assembly protein PilN